MRRAPGRSSKDIVSGEQMFYKVWGGGRAALYVNKKWRRDQSHVVLSESDVCAIQLGDVRFYSVYSPNYSSRNWDTPLKSLAQTQQTEKSVVMGDFNLHHPLWEDLGRPVNGSETLLDLARNRDLNLVTAPNEPTRLLDRTSGFYQITYAASVFTTEKATKERGIGFHAPLAKVQNACLRAVTGAYSSTPVRALEELTNCEPINLVLAKQAAQFEERATALEGEWGEVWKGAERMIERARGRKRRVRVANLSNTMGQFQTWLNGRSAREATEATWAELREREGRSAGMLGEAWTWAHSKRVYGAMTKAQSSLLTQLGQATLD